MRRSSGFFSAVGPAAPSLLLLLSLLLLSPDRGGAEAEHQRDGLLGGEEDYLWERLRGSPSSGDASSSSANGMPHFDPEDMELLLARAAQQIRDREGEEDQEEEEDGESGLRFPALSKQQARFAVNPGYKEFFDEEFRPSEHLGNRGGGGELESGGEGEEGTSSSEHHRFPKKASHSAMTMNTRDTIEQTRMEDIYFTTIVAGSSALAVFAIVAAGFCYHRVRRNSKASEDVDYPAYGVTGPGAGGKGGAGAMGGKDSSSPTSGADRKLAQNAQLYHYQHQKQQMIAFDSANNGSDRGGRPNGGSDCESDDGEEGDYTVYECPGLAPAGEMEVHNPLFQGDTTPKASK